MAFREVSVVQIKELLRRWLAGEGERSLARGAGVARMTARNYIAAAVALGVDRGGGEEQLTDEVIGQICEQVLPAALNEHGGDTGAVDRAWPWCRRRCSWCRPAWSSCRFEGQSAATSATAVRAALSSTMAAPAA